MIELRHVSKSFPTPHGRRYVFRDLSFTFPDGLSIGLIGPNGAGKSTLMRLLGGIDTPDSGAIVTDKRISWPVGLAGGMQYSLSARDNARFVCRLLGATGASMREKLKFVEEFMEVGDYFDVPVRAYSSGMRARLGFALSMAFDFDYYLIDEVMAVGDTEFRRKCRAAFRPRLESANVILVSHNMRDIREWCDVIVLVRDGRATLFEDVEAGILAYQGPGAVDAPVRARRKVAAAALPTDVPSQPQLTTELQT